MTESKILKDLRKYIKEYCLLSSIHGMHYLGEKRTVAERIWWSIVLTMCLLACGFSIYNVYMKWEESPMIINFATKETSIFKIPFPAVTVCPEARTETKNFSLTATLEKIQRNESLTREEILGFQFMSLSCGKFYTKERTFNESITPTDLYDFIDNHKPFFLIDGFGFTNYKIRQPSNRRDDLFVPIITDQGVCYSINILDRSDIFRDSVAHYSNYHNNRNMFKSNDVTWTIEDGYSDNAIIHSYPIRALLAGAKYGMTFQIVTPSRNLDFSCESSVDGYRIILHNAYTIPRPNQQFFRISSDKNVMVAVRPEMTITSKRLRKFDVRRRQCYFESERKLKYFKKYTALNCQLECLTNSTLERANCVGYFMPRENDTPICWGDTAMYMEGLENSFVMYNLMNTFNEQNPNYKKMGNSCDCFPSCSDLNYEVQVTQTKWDWKTELHTFEKRYPSIPISNESRISTVTIFFQSERFISKERNELYGPIDFLANFGGLLGLFTGFSVLSLMEILYFFSVRIIANKCLYGRWAGPED